MFIAPGTLAFFSLRQERHVCNLRDMELLKECFTIQSTRAINISLFWSEELMRLSPRILSLFWLRLYRSVRPLCLRAACGETIGHPSYPQEAQRTQRSHKDL